MNGGALQFHDFVLVDNEKAGVELALILGTSWGFEKGAAVNGTLVVGHSDLARTGSETSLGIVSQICDVH